MSSATSPRCSRSGPSIFCPRRPRTDVRAEPGWEGAERDAVERLDGARLLGWMQRLLEAPLTTRHRAPGNVVLGWRELLVRAVRVRLPEPVIGRSAELLLSHGTHVLRYPVIRAADGVFADGPLAHKLPAAPVELRITNDLGRLELTLSLLWSLWTDPRQPGFGQVEPTRARLMSQGWTIVAAG